MYQANINLQFFTIIIWHSLLSNYTEYSEQKIDFEILFDLFSSIWDTEKLILDMSSICLCAIIFSEFEDKLCPYSVHMSRLIQKWCIWNTIIFNKNLFKINNISSTDQISGLVVCALITYLHYKKKKKEPICKDTYCAFIDLACNVPKSRYDLSWKNSP